MAELLIEHPKFIVNKGENRGKTSRDDLGENFGYFLKRTLESWTSEVNVSFSDGFSLSRSILHLKGIVTDCFADM